MNHISYITIFMLTAGFLYSGKMSAQHCKFFEISFKDSLVADNETNILFNTIKIKNPQKKTVRLGIIIEVPENWKNLSRNKYLEGEELFFNLPPGGTKNLPLNILKQPKTPADWDSVKIGIWVRNVTDTHFYYCHIRAQPEPRFYAQHLTEDIHLETKPGNIPLKVMLRNTGNVEDTYTLQWQNQYLELNDKISIKLSPGKDTTYTYFLKFPAGKWTGLYNENIVLLVSGSGSASFTHPYNITRPKSKVKETESAYPSIPLVIEGGVINQRDKYFYYVGVRGNIHFADENDLNFYYRSKQFGNEVYGIQQNMYLVDYSLHKWRLSAGIIQPLQRFFISNGRGASISYRPDEKREISIAAIIKDPNFYYTSNNFSLNTRFPIGKLDIRNTLTANFDDANALNGYVGSSDVQVLKTEHLALNAKAAAGLEQKTRDVPGVKKETAGLALGYSFSYRTDDWSLFSNVDFYNNDFPGINKGMRFQMHQVTKNFGRRFAGIFYSSNYLSTTYYRDTLYNTDMLTYNTERLGITTGIKDYNLTVSFNTGILKHSGITEFGLNNLYFADLNYSWKPGKRTAININSQNAYKDNVDAAHNSVYMTSTLSSVSYAGFGLLAAYTTRPVFETEGTSQVLSRYDETMTGGPFVNYHLFKNRLGGSLKYQVSKTVYDQVIRTSFGGSVNYNSDKLGTTIQLFANIPLSSTSTTGAKLPAYEDKFITLSLMKQLSVPVITQKKFFDLKVVLYYDINNNGIKDKSDKVLSKTRIDINESESLYTDKKGSIKYLNAAKGDYRLGLTTIESQGLIPVDGHEQSVSLIRNTTMEIAYRKGKSVSGKIKVIRDTFSRTVFASDHIKVTAVDTSGRTFVTLSDMDGNFSFYLPAGIFKISLNPDAFEGSDFKPDKLWYDIDLVNSKGEEIVFVIRQKARKIRFLE